MGAIFGITGFLAQGRSTRALVPMLVGASRRFVPLAMLSRSIIASPASIDRCLSRDCAAARRDFCGRDRNAGAARAAARPAAAGAIFATGTLAALALALTFALEKGWLTIALALMSPAAAWVARNGRCRAALACRHHGPIVAGAHRR